MAATLMDGKALAARIRAEVADDVRELGGIGLTTVLVGDDPASDIYIRLKHTSAFKPASVARISSCVAVAGSLLSTARIPASIAEVCLSRM
jgi:hypothetical protein